MQAVKDFGKKLEDEDQMAILCILSHGKEGTVFGYDEQEVKVKELSSYLNNTNCPQMKHKPKMLIIQACQGGMCSLYFLNIHLK